MRLRKIGGKVIACACLSLSVLMCVPMIAAHAAIPVDTNYAQWDYKPFIYPSSEKNKPDFDGILSDPNKSEEDFQEENIYDIDLFLIYSRNRSDGSDGISGKWNRRYR